MGVFSTRSAMFCGALVLPMLLTSAAEAKTDRWTDVKVTPTQDDGLALVNASFDGVQVFGPTAVPFFTLNGERFELTDDLRVAGPTETVSNDAYQVSATYRVATDNGDVDVTIYHNFVDHDAQWAELGQYGTWAAFSGPEGDYKFYWRVDVDVEGASNDRFQVFDNTDNSRTLFRTPEGESKVDISTTPTWLNRIQAKIFDGAHYGDMSSLFLASKDVNAQVYALRSGAGENEAMPQDLLNGERLQEVLPGHAGTPGVGNDLVLWYEVAVSGSTGMVGPEFLSATLANRAGMAELDAMKRTTFPPDSANIDGNPNATLADAWASGDFDLDVINDSEIPFDFRSSYAEIQGFLNDGKDYSDDESPTYWYTHQAIVWQLQGVLGNAILGVMHDITGYDTNGVFREGATAFWNPISANYTCEADAPNDCMTALLWTTAHELGHSFNLHHEDWEFLGDPASDFYSNSAIMGYSYDIGTLHWHFGPDNGAPHISSHPDEYVRPGYGVDFIAEIPIPDPYNTIDEHVDGHDAI